MLENIKEKVIDELREEIGQTHYLCDLGMTLTESENADGSWYCSSYKAKEDIEEKKKQEVDKSLNERNAAYEKMSVKASVTKEKTVKSKQDVLELL